MGLLSDAAGFKAGFYEQKRETEKRLGRKLTYNEFAENYYQYKGESAMNSTGTSVFDPALCEMLYLWFTKSDDMIIDPFAGGSVRGIVAVELNRHYAGVDLRSEQIEANIKNAEECCTGEMPTWRCGDSKNIATVAPGQYDFIFTCPPYGDLEKYSDDPRDISNMPDDEFDETYNAILQETAKMLSDNRFACVVVGNYRDGKGYLRDLVGLTVRAMESAGCRYYNDFVFVTPAGSLPIRAGKSFQATRKMGRTHQYVLCFVKGDPKKAAERLGDVEIPDMQEYMEEGDETL